MTRRATTLLAGLAIVLAGLAAYSNSLHGAFIFDDFAILNDQAVHRLRPFVHFLNGSRPLVDFTLAVNYAMGGRSVEGYHLVNIAIHILAGLALFGVLRRTFASEPLRAQFGPAAGALSLVAAVLWLVHPLQTESVTYVIQRAESLTGLLYLLTLYAAIRGFASANHRALWHAAAVAACALGMAAKPVMATAPVLVLLYDGLLDARSFGAALRRSRGLYFGLAATWLVLALVLSKAHTAQPSAGFAMAELTPWQYARTQFGVIVHYLRLAFWPRPLCLDYDWPVASSLGGVLPPALFVLALLGATLACLRRFPAAAFAGLGFFLVLAPTSSVMPIRDLCFEHRMYLPLAAVVALTVACAYRLGRRLLELAAPPAQRRRLGLEAGILLCVTVAAAFGYLTFLRNTFYADGVALWSDTVRLRPGNPRALANLGWALVKQNRHEEALPLFLQAQALNPALASAHNFHASALAQLGRYGEARTEFLEGLRLDPEDAPAQCNFGTTLIALGKPEEGIERYRAALRLNPDYVEAHYDLAGALSDTGRPAEAIREYEATLALEPRKAEAHNNLARLLSLQGRPAEALAHYREAQRLMPDSQMVLMNLAWFRATCADAKFRDAGEALHLAARACERDAAPSARALDVLAAAYAEAGRFDDASAAARKAIAAAERSEKKTSAAEIRDRLKLYESGQPFRERAQP